jgi:hypothetical protein
MTGSASLEGCTARAAHGPSRSRLGLSSIFNVVANDTQRVDLVRVGLNYHFNWGAAPAPMATK